MHPTPVIPRRTRRGTAAAGIAALALSVCTAIPAGAGTPGTATSSTQPAGRLLSPVSATGTATTTTDQVLARVDHDGHRLTFVRHTAIGTVGVYESAPLGVTPYLTSLRSDDADRHTALEVFLAVSDDGAPSALVADHARQDGTPAVAIVLPSAQGGEDPADGSCEYNDAIQFGSVWALNWHDGIGQQHDLHNQLSFFDDINGNVGRYFDANRSSARWLAACNGDHVAGFPDIYLRPRSLVQGTWTWHWEEHVQPGTQVIYWSAGGLERWQLRMREAVQYNVFNVRNWAIGGAIDQPFGIVANGG